MDCVLKVNFQLLWNCNGIVTEQCVCTAQEDWAAQADENHWSSHLLMMSHSCLQVLYLYMITSRLCTIHLDCLFCFFVKRINVPMWITLSTPTSLHEEHHMETEERRLSWTPQVHNNWCCFLMITYYDIILLWDGFVVLAALWLVSGCVCL